MDDNGFIWTGDLPENLKDVTPRVRRAMAVAGRYTAIRGQNWMRDNAKWTDRTGNARNGLMGAHAAIGKDAGVVTFSHSVPYGIWLETRFGGRYAVILPALEYWAPKMMEHIARLAFKKGS